MNMVYVARVQVTRFGRFLERGQLVELTQQWGGRAGRQQVQGARIGLAGNGDGWIGEDSAVIVVTVLHR
jgi:hypothetical protein